MSRRTAASTSEGPYFTSNDARAWTAPAPVNEVGVTRFFRLVRNSSRFIWEVAPFELEAEAAVERGRAAVVEVDADVAEVGVEAVGTVA